MNSNYLKLAAYAILGVVCLVLLTAWGLFAFYGKTDIPSFIEEIKYLVGIIITIGFTLGGFHAAVSANTPTVVAAPDSPPAAPNQLVLPTSVNK
jgi:hypothetical protein